MTVLSSPVAHWHNEPLFVGLYGRVYWAYDAATGAWTLTTNRSLEAGRLADTAGSGAFELTPLTSIPSISAVLSMARRSDNGVLTYRASA